MDIDFRHARYLLSAARLDQLPADRGAEVAFAGRSNAGKSSAINVITGVRGLARTSRTPGRTRELVCFSVADGRRLVDLPGYGYARVPATVKARWQHLVTRYFETRASLAGVVLIADIRRGLTGFDLRMLDWSRACGLPVHLLLTKSDKLGRGAAHGALRAVAARAGCPVQLFSALRRTGVDEARAALAALLAGSRQ